MIERVLGCAWFKKQRAGVRELLVDDQDFEDGIAS